MAGTTRKYDSATLFWSEGGSVGQDITRYDFVTEESFKPAPTSGSFITFPDGSRFRRATAYNRYTSKLSPGSAQYTRAVKLTHPVGLEGIARSSAGGYTGDSLYFSPLSSVEEGGLGSRTSYPVIPTMMRNQAVTKALLKIADQKVNLGENLATMRQTVGLMSTPGSAFWALNKQIRKAPKLWPALLHETKRSLERKGLLTRAAEEYLKYVYGLKPIMQDVHGLIELARGKANGPLLIHGEATVSEQSQSAPLVNYASGCVTQVGGTNVNTRVKCSLWGRINPENKGARALNQLGLLNPLSLGWDLIPWSFVVDWFVPIGPVLSALSAPAGLDFVDGSISARVTASATYTNRYAGFDSPAWDKSETPADGSWHYEGYSRDHLTSWPLPGVWIDSDPFRGDRPLKALALAITSLRSLR